MMTLARAAPEFARRGLPVFPCEVRGKAPLTPNGYLDATDDIVQVAAWWREWPEANIGFVPGRAGTLVLDWDSEEGRLEAVKLGCYSEPTMMVETARGQHLYFRHPGGTIGNKKILSLLDVRADRGYVLLPPSIHPTGVIYRAHGKLTDIRPLPPAVVELLRSGKPAFHPPAPTAPPIDAGTPRRVAYVRAAIEAECMELANTGEGNRNNRLNEAAFSLARFVGTGEADPAKLANALRVAARHAGLPEMEIEKTIASAFRARAVVA